MSYEYSTGRINVVPFTGNFTLKNEDIGKVFDALSPPDSKTLYVVVG